MLIATLTSTAVLAATTAKDEGGTFLVTPGLGLMIWTLIAFGITFFLLKKLAFPRIADALVGEQRAEQQGDIDRLAELLGERAAPIERKRPDEGPVDVRFLGTSRRGRVRGVGWQTS